MVGHVEAARAPAIVAALRRAKAEGFVCKNAGHQLAARGVPYHTEVCLLPYERGGPYPGLILQTQQARVARPVRQVGTNKIEIIGSLEQFNMHIRCVPPLLFCVALTGMPLYLCTHDLVWFLGIFVRDDVGGCVCVCVC